jgi:pyrimidine-specific ribonucleoside hydrolase
MHRKIRALLILSVLFVGQLLGHSGKPKYHVIIDTDGALDDMRSISMFLSANDIRVLAITCSQGTLLPDSVFSKVKSLLYAFHHEGIPVGIGDETGQQLPDWSSFAQSITWGHPKEKKSVPVWKDAKLVLDRATENYRDKITLIALGSLKTYADWVKSDSAVVEKFDKIIWYNSSEIEDGFNYQASPESFDYIRKSGIELVVVSNTSENFLIDQSYLNAIKESDSPYARQIETVHKQPGIEERTQQKHLRFWDDIIPLYLTVPILFESEEKDGFTSARLYQNMPEAYIYESVSTLLESATTTNNRVFNTFPVDTALYKPEYAAMLPSTLEEFGLIEWKAISMTNEIHGHTGIYSIIGAKMGIRAMEYFNVGINNIMVTSLAGYTPPLSCFNDGIQISTGATIGQGLITISDSISSVPTAIFTCNNQEVRISLKTEIAEQMQEDIQYAVHTFGLLSDQYWLYIEKLALKYWSEFSRYEICNISLVHR